MAKKKKASKAECQRLHARKRAMERYGLELTRKDLDCIVGWIQTGNAVFIERQSHRVSIWKLWYSGSWIKVVYDKSRQTIASVLPMEERKKEEDGNEERSAPMVGN